jgi:prefoldin subunit 5
MHEQLQKRLAELKQEYRAGQLQMSELETQQTRLRETMLRISGAIQVLEEVLKSGESSPAS